MRLAYYERQKMLIRAVEKDLDRKLRVEEQAAGMHVIGWLPENADDREVSAALLKKGIIANALSEYTLKYRQPPGLLLGYTAFNKFRIRHYVQKMDQVLK
jgi:GntR family transcriptional regulator/MocR family aminotransferase